MMRRTPGIMTAIDGRLTRRRVLGYGLAGTVLWTLGRSATPTVARTSGQTTSPHTWLLSSTGELRPPPPGEPSPAELDELMRMQALRGAHTNNQIRRWGAGAGVLPWTAVALELVRRTRRNPVRAGRAFALVHTAIADAVAAAWDAKNAYPRPRPAELAPGLVQQGVVIRGLSTFPSEHAAIAGAAATVLTYLFPEEPAERIAAQATEAASTRLYAGANYRSDVDAGLALGRAIGERAIARGRADGSTAEWNGSGRPEGDGYWRPAPPRFIEDPLEVVAGRWKPWVLSSGDALRPPPPPAWGSPEFQAQLDAVSEATSRRTPQQADAAYFWAGNDGTVTPAGIWLEIARDLIQRDGLDAPRAAQALAVTSVAMADAFISCWDTKYAYWSVRPISADLSLDILFPTPPFPSYTSGHSTISGAAATALGALFPNDTDALAARAQEAADSRLWSGFHFPIDNEVGLVVGRDVGRMVAQAAGLATG
jgi:membrane-associated phospholipid phosphatase